MIEIILDIAFMGVMIGLPIYLMRNRPVRNNKVDVKTINDIVKGA